MTDHKDIVEFRKVLDITNDLLSLKNELDRYFNSIDRTLKKEFLDYIELIYLVEIKTTIRLKVRLSEGADFLQNSIESDKKQRVFLKKWVSNKNELIPLEETDNQRKNYKKENWFKVGLLFANGEMDKLLLKHKDASKVAKVLYGNKWQGFRSYISSSRSKINKPKDSHNIFSKPEKLQKIYDHCLKNNIPVCAEFEAHIPRKSI